ILNANVHRLEPFGSRTEECPSGTPADVHSTLPRVLKPATADDDVATAALCLNSVVPLSLVMPKSAPHNDAISTTDHVDSRSAVSPSFDGALRDPKVLHTRQLDSVAIAFRTDVTNDDLLEHDMPRRRLGGTAVVDVDSVSLSTRDDESAQ